MKDNLQKSLIRDFPNLYSLVHGPTPEGTPFSPMKFGFEVGDGWEPLIRSLSEKLELHGVIATQVKEKFGGLRFYVSSASDDDYDLIEEAESESLSICEDCGSKGSTHGSVGWIRCLCLKCREIFDKKRGPRISPKTP